MTAVSFQNDATNSQSSSFLIFQMYLNARSSLAEDTQIKPYDFDYLKIIGKGSFGKVSLFSKTLSLSVNGVCRH